jgi:hypothetical protein
MSPKLIDLAGKKLGLWAVVRYVGGSRRSWLCSCAGGARSGA